MTFLNYWICFIISGIFNFISLVLSIALETFSQVRVSIKNLIKSLIINSPSYFAKLKRKYIKLNSYPMISNIKNQDYNKKRNRNHKGTCRFCRTRGHSTKKCFQYQSPFYLTHEAQVSSWTKVSTVLVKNILKIMIKSFEKFNNEMLPKSM